MLDPWSAFPSSAGCAFALPQISVVVLSNAISFIFYMFLYCVESSAFFFSAARLKEGKVRLGEKGKVGGVFDPEGR